MINQGLLGKEVHDPWCEITLEAISRWDIDFESRVGKGTSHNTAAASTAGDVRRVLVRSRFHIGPISPKSVCGVKDGCLIDGSAIVVG